MSTGLSRVGVAAVDAKKSPTTGRVASSSSIKLASASLARLHCVTTSTNNKLSLVGNIVYLFGYLLLDIIDYES